MLTNQSYSNLVCLKAMAGVWYWREIAQTVCLVRISGVQNGTI